MYFNCRRPKVLNFTLTSFIIADNARGEAINLQRTDQQKIDNKFPNV